MISFQEIIVRFSDYSGGDTEDIKPCACKQLKMIYYFSFLSNRLRGHLLPLIYKLNLIIYHIFLQHLI